MEDILNDFTQPPAKPASIGVRLGAALVDFTILGGISFVMGIFWGTRTEDADGFGYSLTGFPAFVWFCIGFALIPLMEGLKSQTLGKRLCKIKVVKDDGSPSGVGNSIARHFFDFIDCFLLIGIIVAATNPNHRRIGDLVAGTRVIQA